MKIESSLIVTHKELNQAIEILKRAEQSLVDLDSIICPIRKLIGHSRDDLKMIRLKNDLEHRGIVDSALGHWSLADVRKEGHSDKGFLYFTAFILNEEWFKKNCRAHRYHEKTKQFQLF